MAPDHDVLAMVENLARLVAQLIFANFRCRRAMTEHVDSLEANGRNPRIERSLPYERIALTIISISCLAR